MNGEENKQSTVEEIKELFQFLTKGEPTPDDEIEAKDTLLLKFKQIKNNERFHNQNEITEKILDKVNKWDTLDHWFIETPLPQLIEKFLKTNEEDQHDLKPETDLETEISLQRPKIEKIQSEQFEEVSEQISDNSESKLDISQIIDQVSDRFHGEIEGLKEKIEGLQKELEKKDDRLKTLAAGKVIRKITPKRDSRLPPLEIHIPPIKKYPSKSPDSKSKKEIKVSKEYAEEPDKFVEEEETEDEQLEVELTLENLEESSDEPQMEKVLVEPAKEFINKTEEKKSEDIQSPEKNEEFKVYGDSKDKDLQSIPSKKLIEEQELESEKLMKSIEELESENKFSKQDLTPIPSDKPKEMKKPEIPSPPPRILDSKAKPPEPPSSIKEAEDKVQQEKKTPLVNTIAIEEPSEERSKSSETDDESGITEVKVEEQASIKPQPTGADLFNVFSSVGQKSTTKSEKKAKESLKPFISRSEKKETKKSEAKEEPKESSKMDSTYDSEILIRPIEELPKNKDSLYQELIALEGKRYALEKRFQDFEKRYEKGSIDDQQFKNESLDIKNNLDKIASRITNIRRLISSM